MFHCVIGKRWNDSAESKNLSMSRNFNRENRETLSASDAGQQPSSERSANAHGGNADAHAERESDGCVVPAKSANNEGHSFLAELMEGRHPANRITEQAPLDRTPRLRGLFGVREAAEADKTLRFNNLIHHFSVELQAIYETDFLGFNYVFRPGRGCQQALDALSYALLKKPVNWILDADISRDCLITSTMSG